MQEIRKFVAPEFIFGAGAIDMVGRYAINFGSYRPLIVTDQGVMDAGWAGVVSEKLMEEGLEPSIYSNIRPNPRSSQIMEGAEFYKENKCDIIVAVGGGSPMDAAKAIGIVTTNNCDVSGFEGIDAVSIPGPPIICIPTTAGTSADVSQFAIISNEIEKRKFAIISKTVVPDVALIDPLTCMTMDNYLTACTGIDALVHAVEALVSTANSPIMDIHAIAAIKLIWNNLHKVLVEPDNREYRTNVMLGSLQAGLAFSNASLGAVHAMAHSLGGLKDLSHGECNAMLLNSVIRFNYKASPDRYKILAETIGLDIRGMNEKEILNKLTESIDQFKTDAGIKDSLSGKAIKTGDIPSLAKNAIKDPCMATNPRIPSVKDIEAVYEESL